MKNYGPVSIGTNIEHVEGVDNRHLTIVNQVVPEEQPQSAAPETSPKYKALDEIEFLPGYKGSL